MTSALKDNRAATIRENHALFQRRANNQNWGYQADRIRAACDATAAANEHFTLTGKTIELLDKPC